MQDKLRRRIVFIWTGLTVCILLLVIWLIDGLFGVEVIWTKGRWCIALSEGAVFIDRESTYPLESKLIIRREDQSLIWRPQRRIKYLEDTGTIVLGVSLPLWMPFGISAPMTFLLLLYSRKRHVEGMCPTCGYNLTGNVSGICPECGTTIQANADP
jgi:hypothetical protein